jgi:circadian clock protein KaiB
VTHALELYVAGESVRGRAAQNLLERICEERMAGRYELTVIDVEADPEAGERADVVTTPTMIRRRPEPEVRIVGDVSDEAAVLAALDLDAG